MTLAGIIKNSITYRFLSGIRNAAANSYSYKLLRTPPRYTSPQFMKDSLILRTASGLARLLLRPLSSSGSALRRWSGGSAVFNLKAPEVLAQSQFFKAAAGIRVETALWLAVLYPVVDYLLRSAPAPGFLAGSWDELLLVFIIAAWPVQMALRGKVTYRYTGLDIPVLVYMGIVLFLFFMRSRNVSLAVEGARLYLEYLVWFFIGSNLILNRRQFDALVKGMIGVAALVAVVGVYQYIIGVQMPAGWVDQAEAELRTRVFSIVVSPNVLGSLLVLFIPLTTGQLLISRGRWARAAYLAALAVMLACLVFTFSRGAWLALGLSLTALSLMYNPLLLLIMAAGAIAAARLVPGIGTRLSYMLSPAYLASSQKGGRLGLWQMGLDRLRQDPLFGSGFGTFGGAVAARRVPGSFYVDNFYLKTAVESGLIGLLALLWLLAGAFRFGYVAYRKIKDSGLKVLAAAILSGLLGVAAHNVVENIFEVPMMATYFWLLAGILVSLPHIDDSQAG
ncbi:MAG: O-antigen ligase family protein [Bacillota bacterium]